MLTQLASGLNVVSQEVVNLQAGARHRRILAQTSMGSMPVVAVNPRGNLGQAFGGVLVDAGVSPFAEGGLDEAFGLAIGARGGQQRLETSQLKLWGLCAFSTSR